MSLQEPLLDSPSRYMQRRESVLWSNFRTPKPLKGNYQKRVTTKYIGQDNKKLYIYQGEKPIQNSVFTQLEASNLSFFDDNNKSKLGRSSDLHSKKQQQFLKNDLQSIQQQSLVSEEYLIGRSSGFISQNNLLTKSKARQYKKDHLKKMQAIKKQNELSFKQKLDNFFGEGINSLILNLSPRIIMFLSVNILFDISARAALLYICLAFFLSQHYFPNDYIFLIPILAMIISRVIFIMTLIKINFAQKPSICVAYQKSFDTRSYFQIQNDRLFRRHYNTKNILASVRRSFIPAELSCFFMNESPQKLKIYFLMCMIFKGVEIMIVLPMFVLTLLIGSKLSENWNIVCVSYMLEEAVRYVINFLIINTLSK